MSKMPLLLLGHFECLLSSGDPEQEHFDDGDMAMHRSTGTSNIKAWQLVLAAVDLQDTYIQKIILEARSMAVEATRLAWSW